MKVYQPNESVLMFGPSFDGSGEVVERRVPASDVAAYRKAGYQLGPLPETEILRRKVRELTTPPVSQEKPSDAADVPAKATRRAKAK